MLQYPHVEYRGQYKQAGARITFEWEGSSIAGPWGAAGVLTAESLAVSYYENMLMSDFEDALYLRIP